MSHRISVFRRRHCEHGCGRIALWRGRRARPGRQQVFRNWRRRRARQKVKPGDGHTLKPWHWWHLFWRSLFFLQLIDENGRQQTYAVSVNYFSETSQADLYLNGRHHAVSELPAAFPVPNGVIEVDMSTIGIKRMHYVAEGSEGGTVPQQLVPDADSNEGLRARLDSRHPALSRWLGVVSLLVLVVALVLGAPQLLETITSIEVIAENIGTFTSPVQLPAPVNTALTLAAVLASFERALRLRYNWLLDGGGLDVDA